MVGPIFQLVYISRAVRPFEDAELEELSRVATTSNTRLDITGLLLHDGRRFIQALEGDFAAVDATMARIARDPRHESIAFVERVHVPRRQFGGWAMDTRRVGDTTDTDAFLTDLERTLRDVDDRRLVAAFIGFVMLGRPHLRALRRQSSAARDAGDLPQTICGATSS
ncbi:hypothetical protein ASE95_08945 [Sphingomonas sp. Leaf231]|uniref:BLUF domain-containing protein n=1 Tax=Sphingomonas sp. Leaf231 TaxID=1736301 RepID=UPI0006F3E1B3|nr:BLUF domain-containing protein [Sphingomonas sp. Leaf231]KQN92773.1 hypothetical protein ASE95_08945 [Sphingomonas sp. Leaf231]